MLLWCGSPARRSRPIRGHISDNADNVTTLNKNGNGQIGADAATEGDQVKRGGANLGGRFGSIIPAGMVHAVFPTTFVIMGDSLMYVVLPTAAIEFGLGETLGLATSFWIGLALSINRFIRLASNAFAAAVYYRFGVRWPYVIAVALGALTTLAYGLGSGLVVLLVSRALWGVSYSYLRLGAYLTAFNVGTSQMRGRLIGFFTAGSRGGSLIAVTAGAALFEQTSRGIAFSVLAGLGVLGVIMALRVPNLKPRRSRNTGAGSLRRMGIWDLAVSRLPDHARRIRLPLLSISLMSFAIAFAANGLAIATLSTYVAELAEKDSRVFGISIAVVTLAGLLIGVRWFADLGLALPLGHLSDRLGRRRSIAYGMAAVVAALAVIATYDTIEVLVVVMPIMFVVAVGLSTALDAAIGETSPNALRPAAMARYSTWQDLGAALGPVTGFLIADRIGFQGGFLVAAILLACTYVLYLVATGIPWQRTSRKG